jgi:hypothetical protein
VAFAVVLAGKRLAAYGTDEGALISVRAEMRAQVVCARELLRTEVTLKGRWVFLDTTRRATSASAGIRAIWIGKVEDVVTVVDRGGASSAVLVDAARNNGAW